MMAKIDDILLATITYNLSVVAVDYAGWVCENDLIVLKCNYIIQVQYRELKLQVNLLLVTTINGIEMIYIIMVTMLIY